MNSAKVFGGEVRGELVDETVISADGTFSISLGSLDPRVQQFLIAGVTRGGHMRETGTAWSAHTDVTVGGLGTSTLENCVRS